MLLRKQLSDAQAEITLLNQKIRQVSRINIPHTKILATGLVKMGSHDKRYFFPSRFRPAEVEIHIFLWSKLINFCKRSVHVCTCMHIVIGYVFNTIMYIRYQELAYCK